MQTHIEPLRKVVRFPYWSLMLVAHLPRRFRFAFMPITMNLYEGYRSASSSSTAQEEVFIHDATRGINEAFVLFRCSPPVD